MTKADAIYFIQCGDKKKEEDYKVLLTCDLRAGGLPPAIPARLQGTGAMWATRVLSSLEARAIPAELRLLDGRPALLHRVSCHTVEELGTKLSLGSSYKLILWNNLHSHRYKLCASIGLGATCFSPVRVLSLILPLCGRRPCAAVLAFHLITLALLEWLLPLGYSALWWPTLPPSPEALRVLLVGDPQLLGRTSTGPGLQGLIEQWDSDRFVTRFFKLAHSSVRPDVTIILGDVFDDGALATTREYATIIIPGDNDIGGESEPVTDDLLRRFARHFRNDLMVSTATVDFIKNSENGRQQATFNLFGTFVGHFNFLKTEYRTGLLRAGCGGQVNRMTQEVPPLGPGVSQEVGRWRVLLSHMPLLPLLTTFVDQVILMLHQLFSKYTLNNSQDVKRLLILLAMATAEDHRRVLNLSSTELSQAEISLLSKGLNYRNEAKPDVPRIISGVEASIKDLSHQAKNNIRSRISSIGSDIIVCNSDKGSQTVVMDISTYRSKMMDVLTDESTFIPIDEDAKLRTYQDFRKALLEQKRLSQINSEEFKLFTSRLTTDAYIYGLPKIHKPNVPLRPIVACHRSPSAPLARYLSNFFSPLLKQYNHKFTVHNTPNFIEELWKISPVSLFLSLPHSVIRESIVAFLAEIQTDASTIQTIVCLADICLNMSVFKFESQTYRQIRGSPMGSSFSTVAAELVMIMVDKSINEKHRTDIVLWRRYVDDIFCVCDQSSYETILASLNSYNEDMSFTIEIAQGGVIPFLDVLIIQTPNSYHTTVYYKKISSPTTRITLPVVPIPKKSRIHTHCSLPSFQAIEKQNIIKNLNSAGYPTSFVCKHFYVFSGIRNTAQYRSTCFIPYSYKSAAIARILNRYGVNSYFSNTLSLATKLKQTIARSSVTIDSLNTHNAIYSISCEQCDAKYVGETGRMVKTRMVEHDRSVVQEYRPHLILSAHEHQVSSTPCDNHWLTLSMYLRANPRALTRQVPIPVEHPVAFNLSQNIVHEIMVPTCSYRMGTDHMGYGVLFLDAAGKIKYKVLWLPSRFRQLYLYLGLTVILLLLMTWRWGILYTQLGLRNWDIFKFPEFSYAGIKFSGTGRQTEDRREEFEAMGAVIHIFRDWLHDPTGVSKPRLPSKMTMSL
ncbi:hypothetical protein LAZ67_11001810 [Cordylochernes scorpioides]|uniref:Reverse transcriptase domain-containing protein n=1 Tax=Cordylochernes scorpioides TaxID=51811 RepID=A0ABY6L3K9_9ARAC|nr:hypothetical protein LAZ67_11001810 [Cordylochernes scorpioides]